MLFLEGELDNELMNPTNSLYRNITWCILDSLQIDKCYDNHLIIHKLPLVSRRHIFNIVYILEAGASESIDQS